MLFLLNAPDFPVGYINTFEEAYSIRTNKVDGLVVTLVGFELYWHWLDLKRTTQPNFFNAPRTNSFLCSSNGPLSKT